MLKLSLRNQLIVGTVLALAMIATRGQHLASLHALPSASWAVFFLAGVYLRPLWVGPALLALAGALDFIAITYNGVSSFCVTPAYGMLVPAYGSLWLAGRWYAGRHRDQLATLLPLAASALTGFVVCQLFSSGGFYFLGGRYPDPTLAEFGDRLLQYAPHSLENLALYLGVAAVVHAAIVGVRSVSDRTARG